MSELKKAKSNKKSLKTNITKFESKVNSNFEIADIVLLEFYKSKIVDFKKELNETFDSLFLNGEKTELDAFII